MVSNDGILQEGSLAAAAVVDSSWLLTHAPSTVDIDDSFSTSRKRDGNQVVLEHEHQLGK